MAVTIEEGSHTTADGATLYTRTWKSKSPKARILFVHGFSDHTHNYNELMPYFAERGIDVYAFDQRGWGRSATTTPQRGLTGPTSLVMSDITSMLATLLPSPVPLFLMGHSMGGAEVLVYASTGPAQTVSKLRGVISSAPLIALHSTTRPWKTTVMAGRVAGRLLPRFQLVNKLDQKWLSHDAEANQRWADDPLNHDTGTLEGLAGMLDRAEQLEKGKLKIRDDAMEGGKSRLWLGHGTDDHINLYDASKAYMQACPVKDKTFKTYDGWYHNLHGELEKQRYEEDVTAWILERVGNDGGAGQSQARL